MKKAEAKPLLLQPVNIEGIKLVESPIKELQTENREELRETLKSGRYVVENVSISRIIDEVEGICEQFQLPIKTTISTLVEIKMIPNVKFKALRKTLVEMEKLIELLKKTDGEMQIEVFVYDTGFQLYLSKKDFLWDELVLNFVDTKNINECDLIDLETITIINQIKSQAREADAGFIIYNNVEHPLAVGRMPEQAFGLLNFRFN